MSALKTLRLQIALLSRIEKVCLIALALRIAYPLIGAATGTPPPGGGLIRLFFFVAVILFLIWPFPKLVRKLLWRVRHRLLVTWILVGVVPIVLICALLAEGMFILMGQVVSYMTTSEIVRQSESLRSAAYTLAWSLNHRLPSAASPALIESFAKETSAARHFPVSAIVRNGNEVFTVPPDGAIRGIPAWSKPDFLGLVKDKDRYYIGAHVALENSTDQTQVFLYQEAKAGFFENLLPGIATVLPVEGTYNSGGIEIQRTHESHSGISFSSSRPADADPDVDVVPPPGRGWWDHAIEWVLLLPSTDLTSGKEDPSVAVVASRPSLILKKLFSTLGNFAGFAFLLMMITAILLLIVEIVSVLFAAKLTRSITRAVADLYLGTKKVQTGDFSHRIPVRKTKDQLSELGGSFNTMTERIQDLILEVKEKERMENELEIARDVQAQLFPKELPHLKTLEVWGGCQPARTVSGDYYDFVALGSERAALAIGDISGKGISAALLMAHIQSALRTQLVNHNNQAGQSPRNGVTSPSLVLSILNDHLFTSSPPEKYATFFLGLYSDEGGQLIYTNAGHLAPMLVRRGEVLRLAGDGFPVGLFPGIQYEQQSFCLEPGDVLVAFTDGVTETPNQAGEEFGDQRLKELLMRYSEKPLDRIAGEITTSLGAWAGNVERHDDTTLMLARRL